MNNEWIKNVLYAAVVGDAIGVPVEFLKRDEYQISEMTGGGLYDQPAGTWSDDTSFTLPLIENITEHGDLEALMQKFENFMFRGNYTVDGTVFDVGGACAKAVRNWSINQYPAQECGDPSEFANGNGALMRLAPLAIDLRDESDISVRLKQSRLYTSLTHRHPRSIVGSHIYLELLHELLNGADIFKALENVETELKAALIGFPDEKQELSQYQKLFSPDFKETSRDEIKSSGYVIDTLMSAVWCVLQSNSIDQTILTAVNLGEDTDTVATIAASIASCRFRDQKVNHVWIDQIRNKGLLDQIFDPFIKYEQTKNNL